MAFGNISTLYIPIAANAGASMWETDVRKLLSAAEASADTTTITNHGTGGAVSRLHDPYSTSTISTSTPRTHGWAIAVADMNSVAGARRFIPAGNHVLTARIRNNNAVGKNSCTLAMRVYKVSAALVPSLVATFTSASFNTPALSAFITVTITGDPGEMIFEAGETLQYSFSLSATGTAVTGETYTFETGHESASIDIKIDIPGLKVLADGAGTAAGSGAANGIAGWFAGGDGNAAGAAAVSGSASWVASGVGNAAGVAEVLGIPAATWSFTGAASGDGAANGLMTGIFSAEAIASGVAAVSAVATGIFSAVAVAQGASEVDGDTGWISSGLGIAAGAAVASGFMSSVAGTVGTAEGQAGVMGLPSIVLGTVGTVDIGAGGGGGDIILRPVFLFDD